MIRFVLIFLFLLPASLFAQENDLHFTHFLPGNTNAENTIIEVFQDSRGFLWFGSRTGLYRYDGINFINFQGNPWEYLGIGSSRVESIIEGKDRQLWMGTNKGLFIYDPVLEEFSKFNHITGDNSSISSNKIRILMKDSFGTLWIGTYDGGLNKLVIDNGNGKTTDNYSFTAYKNLPGDPESISDNRISSIIEDRDGLLWIGTERGLNIFDRNTQQFRNSNNDPILERAFGTIIINFVFEDRDGDVWIAGDQSNLLCMFDREAQRFVNFNDVLITGLKSGNISTKSIYKNEIAEDNDGTLWFCTQNGIISLNKENKKIAVNYHKDNDQSSVSNSRILSILIDINGIFWFGTPNGINKTISPKYGFINTEKNFKNDDNSGQVRSFHLDEAGNLFVTGSLKGGFYIINRNGEISSVIEGGGVWTILPDPDEPEKIFWLGAKCLIKYNKETDEQIWFNEYKPGLIRGRSVFALYIDNKGILWIGTAEGLHKMDRITEEVKYFDHDPYDKNSLSHNTVQIIYGDKSGFLWIGTIGGLNRFDPKTEEFIHFNHDPQDPGSISDDRICSIYEDTEGIFWIGTNGGGLNKYDPETQVFQHYYKKDGLPDNVVYGILEDEEKNLWLSTNFGLSRFDPENETFINFDKKYGLQDNEFDRNSYYKSKSGEMYFGGVSGFNHFFPDDITNSNNVKPPVVITKFLLEGNPVEVGDVINGRKLLSKSIEYTDKIELSYRENFFSVEFASLDYTDPEKNSYKFMLDGFEDDWHEIGNKADASFTKVPPGNYTFRVKGSNNMGVWNEEGASLIISISPPFWDALWFKILGIFLMIGTVFGAVFWRLKNTEKQSRLLKTEVKNRTSDLVIAKESAEIARKIADNARKEADTAKNEAEDANKAKSTFLANMSHEIRTPMNAVLGFSELLENMVTDKQQKQYLDSIRSSGKTLLSLINDVLDISKIEAGKMELQLNPVDLKVICNEIKNAFEWKTKEKDLDFTLDIDNKLPRSLLLDEIRIRQILFNLVGNAVKFTENGHVKISLSKRFKDKDESTLDLIFTIEDSGVGISEKQQELIFDAFRQKEGQDIKKFGGTGLGLTITKRVVEILGGKITVESEPGKGSKFNVEIKNVAIAAVEAEEYEFDNGSEVLEFQEATVLIVDDIDVNRTLLIGYLKPYGFNIVEAKDGKETIEMALKHKPDLILLDMKMPVMDGYEATSLIRKNEKLKLIPIIAVTASSLKGEEKTIKEIGCNALVRKPVTRKNLLQELKEFIEYYEVKDEQSTEEELLKEDSLSEESKAGLNAVIEILEKDVFKRYETLKKTFVIDEIGEFAIRLTELGNTYGLNTLVDFGEKLNENVISFNVEQIQILLDNFPKLMENIKKKRQ